MESDVLIYYRICESPGLHILHGILTRYASQRPCINANGYGKTWLVQTMIKQNKTRNVCTRFGVLHNIPKHLLWFEAHA